MFNNFSQSPSSIGKSASQFAGLRPYLGNNVLLAIEERKLGNEGMCSSLSLVMALELTTGMVASHCVVEWPWGMRQRTETLFDALRQLHVHKDAPVGISLGASAPPSFVAEVRRLTGRRDVHGEVAWDRQVWADRTATRIAERVANNILLEQAVGNANFSRPSDRADFLDAMVDRVVGWHHKLPLEGWGSLTPIERHTLRLRRASNAAG